MAERQKLAFIHRHIAAHDQLCAHALKYAHKLRTGEVPEGDEDEGDDDDLFGDNEPEVYAWNMRLVNEDEEEAKKQQATASMVDLGSIQTFMKDGRKLGSLAHLA